LKELRALYGGIRALYGGIRALYGGMILTGIRCGAGLRGV